MYTDRPSGNVTNTDIYILYSDNNGSAWTQANNGLKINDETNGTSQFWPAIAVDQVTGNLGVSWYDARNDTNNVKVQYFGAVSKNGGINLSVNLPLTPGQSDATLLPLSWKRDYLDYTGLAYHNNVLYGVWSDNSNLVTPPYANPNGVTNLDIYVSRFSY